MEMNVISKYIFIIFIFLSCSEKEKTNIEQENTYQIMGVLLNYSRETLVLQPGFPPPPNGYDYDFTTKDSLGMYKDFLRQTKKKQTIAFSSKTFTLSKKYKDEKVKTVKKCTSDNYLMNTFLKPKRNIKININKISNLKKDSLIYFNDKHKKMLGAGFEEIDMILSLSNISFNENYTKAIIIVGVSYERLNGESRLIYLEKKHYNWEIKCEKILSIS